MPQYLPLRWPMGGLVKRVAYTQQDQQTTGYALNVRSDEAIAGRERGGSRPGMSRPFDEQLGSGNKVRLVSDVEYVTSSTLRTQLVASDNGLLYREVAGVMSNLVSATTLASDYLTATDRLQKLYIAGDNTSNAALCVYDPVADTLGLVVQTAGTVPVKCRLVATWRDRITLAGDMDNPHLWYMSRQGTPTDWDTGQTDVQRAVSGATSDAGRLGEAIRAIVPHSDDCMVFGLTNSLWILRGDPADGGFFTRLSPSVGIIDANAWCYDPEGFLYFLSLDGLYVMPPGCGSTPSSVSREKLPEELLNIDVSTHRVSLAYDNRHRGIHAFISANTADDGTGHWWIDVKSTVSQDRGGAGSASFWPISLNTDHEPFAVWSRRNYVPSSTGASSVIMGGRDGRLRVFDSDEIYDDSHSFVSGVDYGPFAIAPPGQEGFLDEINVTLALGSGSVGCQLFAAQTAEDAAQPESSFDSYRFDRQALNHKARPRARASYAITRFTGSSGDGEWGIDDITIGLRPAGERRLRA